MSGRGAFNRLVAEEMARIDSMSFEVRRSGFIAWRWTVVLTMGNHLVDEALCMTRAGAERKGRRWLADERQSVVLALAAVEHEVTP